MEPSLCRGTFPVRRVCKLAYSRRHFFDRRNPCSRGTSCTEPEALLLAVTLSMQEVPAAQGLCKISLCHRDFLQRWNRAANCRQLPPIQKPLCHSHIFDRRNPCGTGTSCTENGFPKPGLFHVKHSRIACTWSVAHDRSRLPSVGNVQ